MKKQKVLGRKKQKMSNPTTVAAARPSLPPVDVHITYIPDLIGVPRTFLGRLLQQVREWQANPPQSRLETYTRQSYIDTIVKTSPFTIELSEERKGYLAFCKRAGIALLPIRVVQSHDEKVYNHYVAYCAVIGVAPRTIERWNSLRGKQQPTKTIAAAEKTKKDSCASQRYSRCKHCGEEFVNDNGRPTPSPFAFCGETTLTQGKCKLAWLESHRPACETRRNDRPITLWNHIARVAYRPSLQKVNKRDMSPFEYRSNLDVKSIVDRTVKNPEKNIQYESLMCPECREYVVQPLPALDEVGHSVMDKRGKAVWPRWSEVLNVKSPHQHCLLATVPANERPTNLGFYPANDPLTIERKARQLLIVDAQQREQERLQRVAEFTKTTPFAHSLVWNKSVGEEVVVPSPINIVVCDPETLQQPIRCLFSHRDERSADIRKNHHRAAHLHTQIVVDYLAVPRCPHLNRREYTFICTGQTISMCPDCSVLFTTTFDKERQRMLRTGNVIQATPGFIRLWGAQLDALGLSMNRGMFDTSLLWGSLGNLTERVEELTNSHARQTNTVGCTSTDSDGERHDSTARDRRGKQWFMDRQGIEPKTKSRCWHCGADVYDRAGTAFCSDDCKKRFHDEWQHGGLKEELLEAAQNNQTFMVLFEQINRNRGA